MDTSQPCLQYNIISFDVGIKNMAYCIFSVENTTTTDNPPFKILDWNVLNLIEREPENIPPICQVHTPVKKKGSENPPRTCTKMAKYKWDNKLFCEKHARESATTILPKDRFSLSQLKKMDLEELHTLLQKYKIAIPPTKKSAVENLDAHFEKYTIEQIKGVKGSSEKNANETDLLTLGKHLMQALDENPHILSITHVIIENQISPIANRMKTMQGMLAQYFIMRVPECMIEFISSSNKLKAFSTNTIKKTKREHPPPPPPPPPLSLSSSSKKENIAKSEYKKHKTDGIQYTEKVLQQNPFITSCWHSHFQSSKKRDDLADAFLQGLWYITNKKWVNMTIINGSMGSEGTGTGDERATRKYIITAENLKINSI
jgi:hypothetical protein